VHGKEDVAQLCCIHNKFSSFSSHYWAIPYPFGLIEWSALHLGSPTQGHHEMRSMIPLICKAAQQRGTLLIILMRSFHHR
jgi:hypothetical protein